MSVPPNPLSRYNTYSYHHILIACDSTETAEVLSKSNEFLDFTRREGDVNTPSNPYGKYTARDVNLSRGRTGKYCVIIDGTKDASFVISKASWASATAAADGNNRFTTFAVEGKMTVMEPRGVDFMNTMSHVCDNLESNPGGLVFMLKTIFVGHKSATVDDIRGMDPITNIRPLMFVLYDISGTFTIEGGVYDLSFMGINHGATKTRHIMRGADRVSINISQTERGADACEANTLMGALCKLQKEINNVYKEYYNEVKKKIESQVDSKGNKLKFNGREVVYIIHAEEPYATKTAGSFTQPETVVLKGNTEYIVDQFKEQNTEKGTKHEGGIIHLGKEPSVESAILQIAKRCSKIQNDLKEGIGGIKYTPKVATTIVSTDKKYYVVYKLRQVVEPRNDNDLIAKILTPQNATQEEQDRINADIQRNLLTLDYIFTGKNTDILNFDIKMEMGLAFFQTLVTTDNLNSNPASAEQDVEKSKNATLTPLTTTKTPNDNLEEPPKLRRKTPIFLSTKITDKMLKNTVSPKDTAEFQALLNRHAALENLEAVVEIHGNPSLLNSMNKPPSEILQHRNKTQTRAATGNEQDLFPYWETTPALVKLNIRMPTTENDPPYIRGDATKVFWYEGLYYCFGIEHDFNNGLFTQKLNLISLPSSSYEDLPKNKQKSKKEAESEKEKKETITSKTKSGGSGSVSVDNPENQSQQKTTQTTAQRATNTPPPAEASADSLTAEDYISALFKDIDQQC